LFEAVHEVGCRVKLMRDGLAKVFEYLYGSPEGDDGLMNRIGSTCSPVSEGIVLLHPERKGPPCLLFLYGPLIQIHWEVIIERVTNVAARALWLGRGGSPWPLSAKVPEIRFDAPRICVCPYRWQRKLCIEFGMCERYVHT
jgi:hypothetical protein